MFPCEKVQIILLKNLMYNNNSKMKKNGALLSLYTWLTIIQQEAYYGNKLDIDMFLISFYL